VLEDGRVAFLDYGLVRALDPGTLRLLIEICQAMIEDDQERGRYALEGLGILNAKTPEIASVWEHLKMINAPVLEDRPVRIDPAMVQEIARAGFDPRSPAFQTLRKVGIPGVMITFNRMSFGVGSLLARLEAPHNWQAIIWEMWAGRESETDMGRLEQEWMKECHPDLEPPLAAGSD